MEERISQTLQRKIYIIAFVYFIINALQSYFTPLIDDEAYYWVWSKDLDWGFFDHPPMIALWIKIGFFFIKNALGVRLVSCLMGALGFIVFTSLVDVRTEKQLKLFSIIFFSFVLFQVFGFIATPDSPLLFFGIFYLYMLKKFTERSTWGRAFLLGFSMAALMYSKYHSAFLIIFTLIPFVPKFIKNIKAYAAIIFALLLYVPHLYWQYAHDFQTLEYHFFRRNANLNFYLTDPLEYLLNVLAVGSPFLMYFFLKGVGKVKKNTYVYSMILAFFAVVGFFIFASFRSSVQAQWTLIAYLPMCYLLYQYAVQNPSEQKWIQKLGLLTIFLLFLGRIYVVIPDPIFKTKYHGWKEAMIEAGKKTHGMAAFDAYQEVSLFNFYNYPNKQAAIYRTFEGRPSQYTITDNELNLNHKDITFFNYDKSKSSTPNDSLYINSSRPFSYFPVDIKDFISVKDLKIDILDSEIKDGKLYCKIKISGAVDSEVSPALGFQLRFVAVKKPLSSKVLYQENVAFKPFGKNPTNEIQTIEIPIPENFEPKAENVGYLGFSYKNLDIKNQSNSLYLAREE
ncbi:ArnT family glycosyltransferase [Ornithobacterium rhinotracheale]